MILALPSHGSFSPSSDGSSRPATNETRKSPPSPPSHGPATTDHPAAVQRDRPHDPRDARQRTGPPPTRRGLPDRETRHRDRLATRPGRGPPKPPGTSCFDSATNPGSGSSFAMAPGSSPDPSTMCSPDPASARYESRRAHPKQTRSPNDGFAPCVTNCSTARSSGTNANSVRSSSSTPTTTTTTAPTEGSNNAPPTTPRSSPRSGQATRSNDEQLAPDSSTSTDPQPEPPHGQPERQGSCFSVPRRPPRSRKNHRTDRPDHR
jgi:hypothetical protein